MANWREISEIEHEILQEVMPEILQLIPKKAKVVVIEGEGEEADIVEISNAEQSDIIDVIEDYAYYAISDIISELIFEKNMEIEEIKKKKKEEIKERAKKRVLRKVTKDGWIRWLCYDNFGISVCEYVVFSKDNEVEKIISKIIKYDWNS